MNQLRLIKIFFLLLFLVGKSVFAAGITLIRIPEVLLRETSTVEIQWQEPIQAKMKFGLSSGNYSLETTASGTGKLSFVAADEGMSPGVYYCIISSGSLSSMEFKLIIESTTAPYLRSPVNNSVIATSTPAFRWDPVPGVPFYHLILSDQPVELQEDENGELVLNGGNIIWQVITPNTSVVYGEADPSGFFQGLNQNAPPIMANINYNWIVLNNYGNHPALSSIVQAGVSSFRFSLDSSLPAPALQSPAANVDISVAKIVFRWSPVSNAAAYRLLLSETIEQEGSTSSYILWNPVTTDTFIELQARAFLKGADYSWRVVALDQSGHGVASPIRKFAYKVPNATLHIHTFRSDHSSLPRVELRITPVDGSSELSNLLTTDSGVLDQLVQPGEYTVFAAKTEYADTLATIAVEAGETANVNLVLRKLIQLVDGQVIDQSSAPVKGATVYLQEFQKNLDKTAITDIQGRFSIMLVQGTWFVRAEKVGYTHSDTLAVSLGSGPKATLPSKLKLVENSARLGGFVKTTNGIPLVNCQVVAASEGYKFSAKTDFTGRFDLELLAGQWVVYAEKDGFVRSAERTIQLTPGQSLNLSPDIILNNNAAIVSGIVQSSRRTLPAVRIEAVPLLGTVVGTISDAKGSYLLSLPAGDFKIRSSAKGFVAQNEIYLQLQEKQTLSGMNLMLEPATSQVRGFVKNGSLPVVGALVSDGSIVDTSKADGSFALSLSAGEHTLQAYSRGLLSTAAKTVTLQKGEIKDNINFAMTSSAGVIEGTVTSAGQNVPDVRITARNGDAVYTMAGGNDGTYWISLPAGVWNLTVEKVGFETGVFDGIAVNAGQTISGVDFNLVFSQAVLRGTVKDSKNRAVKNAQVQVLQAGVIAGTDGFGNYAVSLNPGSFTAVAEKSGFLQQSSDVSVSKNNTTVLNFQLPIQGVVKGVVKSRSNIPLDRIEIVAIGADTVKTQSDFTGEFIIHLNQGSYQLTADRLGYAAAVTNLSVSLGDTLTKNFSLAEAPEEIARIKGKIVDSRGQPMSSVAIRLISDDNTLFYSNLNGVFDTNILATGLNYKIEPFAPGRFFIPASRSYNPLVVDKTSQNFDSGLFGDVSANENVSSFDGSLVLRIKAEQDVSPYYKKMPRDSIAADVSGNNEVSPFDASLIFRYSAGLIDEFPGESALLAKPRTEQRERVLAMDIDTETSGRIRVNLLLDKADDIYSGELVLAFDPEAVSFTKVQKTVLTGDVHLVTNVHGSGIKILFAGEKPLAGEGAIFQLFFTAKKNGSTTEFVGKKGYNFQEILISTFKR